MKVDLVNHLWNLFNNVHMLIEDNNKTNLSQNKHIKYNLIIIDMKIKFYTFIYKLYILFIYKFKAIL